ncbi:MAG: 50S ribosomal protein L17 [Candidatus Pacebacteria bacterium]|nr:50S ribosomal protein L17 [Candidatus Paceibacterota bacterium]
MQHHNKNRKFGRERKVRTGLIRSLAHNLILEGKMITTEAKAKSLRPYVERLVTHAKTDTVANRRLVASRLGNDEMAVTKLFAEIGPRYVERNGGYTRIVKVGIRKGDASVQAFIGFV